MRVTRARNEQILGTMIHSGSVNEGAARTVCVLEYVAFADAAVCVGKCDGRRCPDRRQGPLAPSGPKKIGKSQPAWPFLILS